MGDGLLLRRRHIRRVVRRGDGGGRPRVHPLPARVRRGGGRAGLLRRGGSRQRAPVHAPRVSAHVRRPHVHRDGPLPARGGLAVRRRVPGRAHPRLRRAAPQRAGHRLVRLSARARERRRRRDVARRVPPARGLRAVPLARAPSEQRRDHRAPPRCTAPPGAPAASAPRATRCSRARATRARSRPSSSRRATGASTPARTTSCRHRRARVRRRRTARRPPALHRGRRAGNAVGRQIVSRSGSGWVNGTLLPIRDGAPPDPAADPQGGFVPETLVWDDAQGALSATGATAAFPSRTTSANTGRRSNRPRRSSRCTSRC